MKTATPQRRPAQAALDLQRKPLIGPVDDPLEREADRVADAIVAGAAVPSITGTMPSDERPTCPACEAEEQETVQRKWVACQAEDEMVRRQIAEEEEEERELQLKADAGGSLTAGAADAAAAAVALGGRHLSPAERAYFEPRFGRDISGVRLHENARAGAAARAIGARAYTLGRDIAFAPGACRLGSVDGRRLMAHELAHVVQQGGAHVIRRHRTHVGLTPDQRYEHTLEHAHTNRTDWERGYRAATFLGLGIRGGVHRELNDRLTIAENHLRDRFPDRNDAEIADEIGLYSISGRRPPRDAVGGSSISNHAFGLAIDVNYQGNPFVGRSAAVDEIFNRASLFVNGEEFHIRAEQTGTTEEIRARYAEASAALSTYFRYFTEQDWEGLSEAISRAALPEDAPVSHTAGSPYTTETMAMMEQIERDYNNPDLRSDFATNRPPPRDPAAGFIDLSAVLVEALVDQAGLTWGGQYRTAKDIMHFDWRGGTVRTGNRI